MRLLLCVLVFMCVSCLSFGQSGNYFLSHYSPSNEEIDLLSFDIAQDNKGVLYFANKSGILEFDGRNWTMIHSPAPIYTTAVTPGGSVYAGGLSGFGRIVNNDKEDVYESLSSQFPKASNVFQSLAVGERVYFLSADNLYILAGSSGTVANVIQPSKDNVSFDGLFEIDGEVYVSTTSDEILALVNDVLERSQVNPSAGEILFTHTLRDKKRTLVGTSADRMFVYENKAFTEIQIKDIDYVRTNVLVSGAWVNESLIALGTLRGGVIFISPQTGETQEITNYYTGLPDNEVFAMLGDHEQCIWVAHDYGYSRIAPSLPFRTFNHYPGLEGNLLCAYSLDNNVYVGTTLGLYKLVKDEIYEEEDYFVTRKKSAPVAERSIEETKHEEIAVSKSEKHRRGLFGLGRKKDKAKEPEPVADAKTNPKKPTAATITVREKRTRLILKSLQYRYHKVEGIHGKVTHLITVDGKLTAAGLGGVFTIDDRKATMITQEPVRSIFLSPSLDQIFISTYNEEIKSLARSATAWYETHMLDTIVEYVSYMFEDKLQNLWLCGRAGVLKVEMIDKAITNIEKIPYLKPSIDETVGLAVGSDVYVVNAGEFQLYDPANERFVDYDSLPGTRKYFASAGSFWFHDGHRWRTIDNRLTQTMQLDWLGLVSEVRYLTTTNDESGLWIITADNELYRFTPTAMERPSAYPLFLKDIRGPVSMMPRQQLEVEEEQGALTFEFIQPDYNGLNSIEYRYLVSGMSELWTDWSPTNNVIPFPFLPSGDYEITVQSKNVFGKVNELEKISFSVLPPYWRTPWFYALEVTFFSLLVLLSVRLSVSNEKYRPISRVLSLLTVIMFIQLVQTSAYSWVSLESSPVVEFLIQVSIALLVLPLELRLRHLMDRASQGHFDLSKILVRKANGTPTPSDADHVSTKL